MRDEFGWIAALIVLAIAVAVVVPRVLANETVSPSGKRRVVLTILLAVVGVGFVLLVWPGWLDFVFMLW